MMRNLSIYAAAASALAAAFAARGDSLALDDREGVFGGASGPAHAAMAYQNFCLEPESPVCLHGSDDFQDFTPVFSPVVSGVGVWPSVLSGFTFNTNGTLRLSLGADGSAEGTVVVGAPPLLWGDLQASASIHRCIGGVQEICFACGRRHSLDTGYDCSHDADCVARLLPEDLCTCGLLFVRVNWDDDNWNVLEDRLSASPCDGDDDLAFFRALGVGRMCCCYGDISGSSRVAGLTASSGLRLWSGVYPAGTSASAFGIEAVAASPTIGGSSVSYEVRDETNAVLRSVTLHVTAANAEICPDFDDDGVAGEFDRFSMYNGTTWQLRVRDEPYALFLASECPQDASASLEEARICGVTPAIRASAAGGEALQPDVPTASSAFVPKNGAKTLYVDTSGGPGMASLLYSLGFGSVHPALLDTRIVKVVDLSVPERWETTNSLARLVYDYSDVYGYVEWTIWREGEPSPAAWGTGAEFSPGALPPGDYEVEVYFAEVFEGGCMGYTSLGALHVIDVRLASLFETANEANRIFNPTRKDDTTGNQDAETEVVNAGTPLEERYAAPRNFLYTVGDPVTGNFNVSARFDATCADGCTNYYCAFYPRGGGPKIPGTETNVDFTASSVSFSLPAPSLATNVVWELRGGLDLNGNATLDSDEAAPFAIYTNSANVVKYACLKGITKEQYSCLLTNVQGKVYYFGDNPPYAIARNARSLLALFYANGNEGLLHWSMRPTSSTNFVLRAFSNDGGCFSEWLTHNSGALFGADGCAQIVQYRWTSESLLSQFLFKRTPFALKDRIRDYTTGIYTESQTATGLRLRNYYENHIRDDAEAFLQNAPDGTECYFPTNGYVETSELLQNGVFVSISSNWVSGVTVSVGKSDGYGGWGAVASEYLGGTDAFKEYDALGTIGKGRLLNPRYRFRVKKNEHLLGATTYDVVSVAFSCELRDLYDFNYEDGTLPACAAALQIGFGAGGTPTRNDHGKIFTHVIEMQGEYSYPFDCEGY